MKPCIWDAGAADGSVKVWDTRHLKDAMHTFKLHDSAIMRVEWAPYKKGTACCHWLSRAKGRFML